MCLNIEHYYYTLLYVLWDTTYGFYVNMMQELLNVGY